MENDAKVLQKTGGVFINVLSYKKALGQSGKLEKHEHSPAYTVSVEMENMKNRAMKKPIHTQIVQQSENEREFNRKSLNIFSQGLHFLVKNEVAHTTKYEILIESILGTLNDNFKTWRGSQNDRSNYSSKDTACELLICMGEILESELKEKHWKKTFSTLTDESTSLDTEMELSIMFRFMKDKGPVEKFLAIVKIPNGTAETIADAIEKNWLALMYLTIIV